MTNAFFSRSQRRAPRVPQGVRSESAALLRLAPPLILIQVADVAIYTTDIAMMGWLGPEKLAAGALAGHLYGFFYFFGMGVMAAVAPMVAQALGARQRREVRRAVRQGLWAAVLIAAPVILVLSQSDRLLLALGQSERVVHLGRPYLLILLLGYVPVLWFLVLSHFISAHSRPRAAMVATIVAIAVNALANYGLMFGHFGLPRLELVGAAVSSVAVDLFLVLSLASFVAWDRQFRRYRVLARIWRADWPRLRELLRIGLPNALWILAEVGLFGASGLLIGAIGTAELAGHAVALTCAATAYTVPQGLAQAATIRVGLAAGSGRMRALRRSAWLPLGVSTAFALGPALLFWFGAGTVIALFLDRGAETAAAAAFAAEYLAIAAFFQFADASQAVAGGALRGLKDTRAPFLLAALSYWGLGFGSAAVLGFVLDLGGRGVWMGLVVGLTGAAVLLIARLRVMLRRAALAPAVVSPASWPR